MKYNEIPQDLHWQELGRIAQAIEHPDYIHILNYFENNYIFVPSYPWDLALSISFHWQDKRTADMDPPVNRNISDDDTFPLNFCVPQLSIMATLMTATTYPFLCHICVTRHYDNLWVIQTRLMWLSTWFSANVQWHLSCSNGCQL